jgi:hypothetical protein
VGMLRALRPRRPVRRGRGTARPGGVCDVPVMSIDFLPTLLEAAGGLKREALFWRYPHYQLCKQGGTTPYGAARASDFKLVEFHDDRRADANAQPRLRPAEPKPEPAAKENQA